ncbi:MAG: ABC transporter substrate-binding protein [Oleispira sp.]|nr:ABC transporter substrate-binding protein [Oleispira sp.]
MEFCRHSSRSWHCLLTGMDNWLNAPEKVLGVTLEWAQANPNTHAALIRALYQACHWLELHAEQALPFHGYPIASSFARK